MAPSPDGRGVLFYIADDLTETWLEDWVDEGICKFEALVENHRLFDLEYPVDA